jgi:low affinity Fe/Cu permease
MTASIYILLAVNIVLFLIDIILFKKDKKKIDEKIENLLLKINQTDENIGKLGVKVSRNGDDIQKIRQEKFALKNELNSIHSVLETLNNGFAIPSYKNT